MMREHNRKGHEQLLVRTPYGQGLVTKEEDDGKKEVKLSGFKGTLYTHDKLQSIPPKVGDDVLCTFGRGTVLEISNGTDNNNKCKVRLSSWRLASRNTVTCYLQTSTLSVTPHKTIRQMDTFERVRHGQSLKAKASQHFTNKSYSQALQLYSDAIDAVRFVQHDAQSDNYVRADLVLLMVTCSNNAATCCIQLHKYDEAYKFATNALVLLDALYEKRGKKIHCILKEDGVKDGKLFGEFRNKSRLVIATACFYLDELDKAMERLKEAEQSIGMFLEDATIAEASLKVLRGQEKQRKKLHAQCLHKRKMDRKKEIKRAQAMFGAATTTAKSASSSSVAQNGSNKPTATSENDNGNRKTSATTTTTQQNTKNRRSSLRRTSSEIKKVVTFAPSEKNQTHQMDGDEKKSDSDLDDFQLQRGERENDESEEEDSEDEMMPWYEEHKEALILMGVAGLAGLSTMLLRSSKP